MSALETLPIPTLISKLQTLGFDDKAIEQIGMDTKKLADVITKAEAKKAGPAMDVSDCDEMKEKTILVIGECGDGKSTLVNALRDMNYGDGNCEVDRDSEGVTKEIISYIGKPINGYPIRILDTPGIGDSTIHPPELISMIQEVLGDECIDGVVVTTKIHDGRAKLGAQVVQKLVEEAMISDTGNDKWENIILAGTQRDIAKGWPVPQGETSPIEHFIQDKSVVNKQGNPKGTVANFFKSAPGGFGKYCLVEQSDYSELETQITKLPTIPIKYRKLSASEVSELLAGVMGMDKEEFKKGFEEAQKAMEEKFNQRAKEMEDEYKKALEAADEKQRLELERLEKERKAADEKVRKQIEDMQEQRRLAEEKAKEEVEALKAESEKKMEEFRKNQEAAVKELETKSQKEADKFREQMEQDKKKMLADVEKRTKDAELQKHHAQLQLQELQAIQRNLNSMPIMLAPRPGYNDDDDYCPRGQRGGGSHGGGGGGGGRKIHTGPRGGRYYINSNGNKTYVR